MNTTPLTRTVWLVIAIAFVASTFGYGGVLYALSVTGSARPAAVLPVNVFRVLALAALAMSVWWTRLNLRAPVTNAAESGDLLPDPVAFQRNSIIAFAQAESAAVMGLVVGVANHTPVRDYLPFAAGAVLVMLLDTIPAGLAYWNAREAADRTPPGGGPPPIR